MAKFRGKFGANYAPKLHAPIQSGSKSFSIKVQGYTFNIATNFDEWAKYTEAMKMHVATEMYNTLAATIGDIGVEAIKRCPHYSGALEKSIRVTIPEFTSFTSRGRLTSAVGVLSSWKSTYDDYLAKLRKQYPMSSPEHLRYIHEYYDTFIENTFFGKERRDRKQAITGVKVGSHFLTRAWTECDYIKANLQGFVQRVRGALYSTGATTQVQQINAMLQNYAQSLNLDSYEGLLSAVKNAR